MDYDRLMARRKAKAEREKLRNASGADDESQSQTGDAANTADTAEPHVFAGYYLKRGDRVMTDYK